jgi:hypothetical protein
LQLKHHHQISNLAFTRRIHVGHPKVFTLRKSKVVSKLEMSCRNIIASPATLSMAITQLGSDFHTTPTQPLSHCVGPCMWVPHVKSTQWEIKLCESCRGILFLHNPPPFNWYTLFFNWLPSYSGLGSEENISQNSFRLQTSLEQFNTLETKEEKQFIHVIIRLSCGSIIHYFRNQVQKIRLSCWYAKHQITAGPIQKRRKHRRAPPLIEISTTGKTNYYEGYVS